MQQVAVRCQSKKHFMKPQHGVPGHYRPSQPIQVECTSCLCPMGYPYHSYARSTFFIPASWDFRSQFIIIRQKFFLACSLKSFFVGRMGYKLKHKKNSVPNNYINGRFINNKIKLKLKIKETECISPWLGLGSSVHFQDHMFLILKCFW